LYRDWGRTRLDERLVFVLAVALGAYYMHMPAHWITVLILILAGNRDLPAVP
jgi:hypothetical protein